MKVIRVKYSVICSLILAVQGLTPSVNANRSWQFRLLFERFSGAFEENTHIFILWVKRDRFVQPDTDGKGINVESDLINLFNETL